MQNTTLCTCASASARCVRRPLHTFSTCRCACQKNHFNFVSEMKASQDFEIIEYNPHEASPEEKENYQSVNPHGSIPVLLTSEGDVVLESAAICLYLAKLYRQLLPDERNEGNYFRYRPSAVHGRDICAGFRMLDSQFKVTCLQINVS